MKTSLKFKYAHDAARPPTRSFDTAAGFDVYALVVDEHGRGMRRILSPHNTLAIRTGILIEPPPQHTVLVCSRSGMAKNAIFVTNSPGVIDPDYRGEIIVLLHNGGLSSHYVQHGDRIAQLLVLPFPEIELCEVDELSSTERGAQGFGSTGR